MQYVTCQFTNSILLVNCKRLYIYEKFKSAKIYKILKKKTLFNMIFNREKNKKNLHFTYISKKSINLYKYS